MSGKDREDIFFKREIVEVENGEFVINNWQMKDWAIMCYTEFLE